ncbi:MAG: CU044_2847 family protein [Cyanobacteria bacterium P01_A01_bin.123]
MTQLIPIQIDTDTIIYVEPATDVQVQLPAAPSRELTRADLDLGDKGAIEDATRKAMQSFAAMETTIETYTRRTLNAFRKLGSAEVDKVQLEFGINLGGEAGVPYVTRGTAECSLKITVECTFAGQKTE